MNLEVALKGLKETKVDCTYWVYILQCSNDSYYIGYTTDLERRYQEHLKGIGSKYTRSFKPLAIAQSWEIIGSKSTAMKIECYIKKLSKIKKKQLILYPHLLDLVVTKIMS